MTRLSERFGRETTIVKFSPLLAIRSPVGDKRTGLFRSKSRILGSPLTRCRLEPSRPRTTIVPFPSRYANRELSDDHLGQRSGAQRPGTFKTTFGAPLVPSRATPTTTI